MRHLAAYLLLVVGGNATPTAADVTAVLDKAGIEVDSARLDQLLGELEGKDVAELIELGKDKLYAGGMAAAAAAPAAAASAGGKINHFKLFTSKLNVIIITFSQC